MAIRSIFWHFFPQHFDENPDNYIISKTFKVESEMSWKRIYLCGSNSFQCGGELKILDFLFSFF